MQDLGQHPNLICQATAAFLPYIQAAMLHWDWKNIIIEQFQKAQLLLPICLIPTWDSLAQSALSRTPSSWMAQENKLQVAAANE